MSKRLRLTEEKNRGNPASTILFSLIVIAITAIVYLAISLNGKSDAGASSPQQNTSAVSESNGIQYIDISAKGGYTPREITAKANTKSVLRVTTSATFDCSSALVIPSLNYRNNLPPTAVIEIDIPPQTKNSVLRGSCAMGMYRFNINFN
jgi:plastocyanin domain-containing protein